MAKMLLLAALVIMVTFAGCSERSAAPDPLAPLRQANTVRLFSLDPQHEPDANADKSFHGWHVLGTVAIHDPAVISRLVEALAIGIADNGGGVASCFDPRHGIQLTINGRHYDYVICFRCYSARWYIDDEQYQSFATVRSSQAVFDSELTAASIELAAAAID